MSQRTPDPRALTGYYDTSETGGNGARHAQLTGVSAVFDQAKARDLAYAMRSLDPDDEAVPPVHVNTSPGLTVNRGDPAADAQRLASAAARSRDQLRASGMDIDPVTGAVTPMDPTSAWQNHARNLGPMVQVDEHTDRSAG